MTTLPASRILIIEDDPILLDTMSSTLRLKMPDAHIETAESTLRSLEQIRSLEYAAILADGHQHRLEGIRFVRAVHKIDPQCPVLLLVEKHHEDLFRQALDAGAYDVLVKPVEEGSLLFAVQRAIEVSRLRHQVTRAHAQFVASVGRTMRDLEVLYSAYGLEGHFEALMASLEVEKTAFAAEPQPRAGESGHGAAASDARVMKRQF